MIRGGFAYGSQVYHNYTIGEPHTNPWTAICWGEVGIAMVRGGVAGVAGYVFGPLAAVASRAGLAGSILGGMGVGAVSDGLGHIAANLARGQAWDTGLGQAMLVGSLAGGVGGMIGWSVKRIVQIVGFRNLLRLLAGNFCKCKRMC